MHNSREKTFTGLENGYIIPETKDPVTIVFKASVHSAA